MNIEQLSDVGYRLPHEDLPWSEDMAVVASIWKGIGLGLVATSTTIIYLLISWI